MRILAAAALGIAFIATPAFAQDSDSASDGTYSGFHIEAVGGYEHVSAGGTNENGAVYGASAGFDGQAGGVVLGVEAEGTFGTVKWCAAGPVCVDSGRDLYGGVRIGGRVGQTGLVYIKGGYTNAQVNITGGSTPVFSDELDGVRVGIGVEGRKGRLLVRAEYRYSNYEQGFTRQQVLLGVGVHF